MRPFRTVLFAADFSGNSKEAFHVACSLAVENKTRLFVVHVLEPNWLPDQPVYLHDPIVQFVPTRGEGQVEAVRQKLCEVYRPNHPIDIAYDVRQGDAKTEILRIAQEIGSDLIVTGTHGLTGAHWLLAGSVAIAVMRGAHCPVLALRAHEVPYAAEHIQLVLHPTDFSRESEQALQVARLLARDLGARLIILYVVALEIITEDTEAAQFGAQDYQDVLEQMRKRLDGPDLKYPVETRISLGFPPDEILTTAAESRCDLVVMGTHGRTGLLRSLMGSVAESVLTNAECPVMIVKAGAKAT
jgi:nucleotide-binding universal stress UspA family protein